MSVTFWTLWAPLSLVALSAAALVITQSQSQILAFPGAIGLIWIVLTGKTRKTYWNARLRARAHDDARRSRSR